MLKAALLAAATAVVPPQTEKPVRAESAVEGVVVTAPSGRFDLKLNPDPEKRFAAPEYPYLLQRPVNGCKPMAGGATTRPQVGPKGAAAGLVCVKTF